MIDGVNVPTKSVEFGIAVGPHLKLVRRAGVLIPESREISTVCCVSTIPAEGVDPYFACFRVYIVPTSLSTSRHERARRSK